MVLAGRLLISWRRCMRSGIVGSGRAVGSVVELPQPARGSRKMATLVRLFMVIDSLS